MGGVIPFGIIIDRKDEVFSSLLSVFRKAGIKEIPSYTYWHRRIVPVVALHNFTVITSFKVAKISLYLHRQDGHLF